MKKLKGLKHLEKTYEEFANDWHTKLQGSINNIKEEHELNVMHELSKLLKKVCDDHELDFNVLKHKYLPNKAISLIVQEHPIKKINEPIEELLDKTIIEDKEYYYENKEDGKVYDNKTKVVGVYKNNKVILDD